MPARKPKRAPRTDPISERIRIASEQYRNAGQERIGLSAASYEDLAVLVERGRGLKHEVLHDALAIGLRAMRGEPVASSPPDLPAWFDASLPGATNGSATEHVTEARILDSPVAQSLFGGMAISQPILGPDRAEGDDRHVDDTDDDDARDA